MIQLIAYYITDLLFVHVTQTLLHFVIQNKFDSKKQFLTLTHPIFASLHIVKIYITIEPVKIKINIDNIV